MLKRENKGPHSGPKYGVMNGGFPLIYDSFMGQIRGPFNKKKTAHMESTQWHVGLSKGALPP
jgi:hypothetical protein